MSLNEHCCVLIKIILKFVPNMELTMVPHWFEIMARRVLGMRTRSFNKTGFDWLIDWSTPKRRQFTISTNAIIRIINVCIELWKHKLIAQHSTEIFFILNCTERISNCWHPLLKLSLLIFRYFTYLSVHGDRMKFDLAQAAAEAR